MWGLGTDYAKADMLGDDKIHMAMVPDFSGNGERAIFTDSWSYVLNSASKNKDAAIKFLQYMADEGGMEASYKGMPPSFFRYSGWSRFFTSSFLFIVIVPMITHFPFKHKQKEL